LIYVYAIAGPGIRAAPKAVGLEDAPVGLVRGARAGAVVSAIAAQPPATEAGVLRHESVVEAAMELGAVLPVRFGTVVADEDAAREALDARAEEFAAGLKRVRGRVELALRVLWNERGSDKPQVDRHAASGRDYLLASLTESRRLDGLRRRAEARARGIHRPLASLAADSTFRVLNTSKQLLLAAYLVDRKAISAFRRELDQLTGTNPDLKLFCTGPWPPFSFVGSAGGVTVDSVSDG